MRKAGELQKPLPGGMMRKDRGCNCIPGGKEDQACPIHGVRPDRKVPAVTDKQVAEYQKREGKR